jgi:hypothetical protein
MRSDIFDIIVDHAKSIVFVLPDIDDRQMNAVISVDKAYLDRSERCFLLLRIGVKARNVGQRPPLFVGEIELRHDLNRPRAERRRGRR